MGRDIAEQFVEDFERGLLSRRQLVSRLMGLGATLAVIQWTRPGQPGAKGVPSRPPGSIMSPWT